mgnify:CR=1 FL=1
MVTGVGVLESFAYEGVLGDGEVLSGDDGIGECVYCASKVVLAAPARRTMHKRSGEAYTVSFMLRFDFKDFF